MARIHLPSQERITSRHIKAHTVKDDVVYIPFFACQKTYIFKLPTRRVLGIQKFIFFGSMFCHPLSPAALLLWCCISPESKTQKLGR